MTDDIAILVRCDGPAGEVARLMVERLGFDPRRDLGPGTVVHRNYPDDGSTLHVEEHRAAEAPWSGYDVAITGDFGDEMLAWELFDEFVTLGRPAALKSGPRLLRAMLADPATLSPVTDEPVDPGPADDRAVAYERIMADPDSDELRLSYADLVGGSHAGLIRMSAADYPALAATPAALRWLGLARTGVTPAGIEALAAAGTTPQLRYVDADVELRLQPEACYDYLGAHVWTNSASLARVLGERYPSVAWLQRGDRDIDRPGYEDV